MTLPQPKIEGNTLTSMVILYEKAFTMVMASNLRSGRAVRTSQSPESNDRNVCVRRCPRGLLTDFQPRRRQQFDQTQANSEQAARDIKDYTYAQKTAFIETMQAQLAALNRDLPLRPRRMNL
jgi:hypothetical protein